MIDFRDYLTNESDKDFTKSFKDEVTKRVFSKLDDMKRTMAKDYLKSAENEPSWMETIPDSNF